MTKKRATLHDCVVCWAYRHGSGYEKHKDLDWHVWDRVTGRFEVTACEAHEPDLAAALLRITSA
jgi:hypothetical protein